MSSEDSTPREEPEGTEEVVAHIDLGEKIDEDAQGRDRMRMRLRMRSEDADLDDSGRNRV